MTSGRFPNMPEPDDGLEIVGLDDPDELVVIEVDRPELEGAVVVAVDDLPPTEGGGPTPGPVEQLDFFSGDGPPPDVLPGAGRGDLYLDRLTGELYKLA